MAVLCREFDISRKTGYKLFSRYKNSGIEGLTDRSRRPYRHANRLPFQIEQLILQLKEKHASWGANKIRDKIKMMCRSARAIAGPSCMPAAVAAAAATAKYEVALMSAEITLRNFDQRDRLPRASRGGAVVATLDQQPCLVVALADPGHRITPVEFVAVEPK